MKVCLVTIAKMENLYIKEFVEHYYNLGFDNIILGDNNNSDETNVRNIINDYINNGFVKIYDLRDNNTPSIQQKFYMNIYLTYKNEYDWFCFFDVDEYLYLDKFNNIKDFLNQQKFEQFNVIHVNWLCYNDNNLLTYDNRKLKDRFTQSIEGDINFHIKSFIKNVFDYIIFFNPHTIENNVNCCDVEGNVCENKPIASKINYNGAHIKHYLFKTLSEYIENKIVKGRADIPVSIYNNFMDRINIFKQYNNMNSDKENIISKYYEILFLNKL